MTSSTDLWTCLGTVHDGVAPVHAVAVLHLGQPLGGVVVPRVNHPPVGLHEHSGAEVLVRVPPVAGAGGAAAGTQDALVQAVLEEGEGGIHFEVMIYTITSSFPAACLRQKRTQ